MPAAVAISLEVTGQLRWSVQRLSRRLRKRGAAGLTPSKLSALSTLERHGAMRIGRLAALEQVTKSSITRLVASLEAAGHITRMPDVADGRSAVVELTSRGRALLQESDRRADAYLASQIGALTPDEQRRIRDAVPVLVRLLDVKA